MINKETANADHSLEDARGNPKKLVEMCLEKQKEKSRKVKLHKKTSRI